MTSWCRFQSTRPIRGATLALIWRPAHDQNFNPRAPYGARLGYLKEYEQEDIFQSTRPIRGATHVSASTARVAGNFNPRAPYGARHLRTAADMLEKGISIHAPHTGRDDTLMLDPPGEQISIHAPHTGRDALLRSVGSLRNNFNPRAPYGARQQKCIIYVLHFCNNRQSKHKNQQETSSVRTFF